MSFAAAAAWGCVTGLCWSAPSLYKLLLGLL